MLIVTALVRRELGDNNRPLGIIKLPTLEVHADGESERVLWSVPSRAGKTEHLEKPSTDVARETISKKFGGEAPEKIGGQGDEAREKNRGRPE
jgi:hypothetical protein